MIGDGRRANFWSNSWSNGVCLREEFLRLYSLSEDNDGSVKLFHDRRDAVGNWVFNFRRSLFAWKEDELSRLKMHLSSSPLLREKVVDC